MRVFAKSRGFLSAIYIVDGFPDLGSPLVAFGVVRLHVLSKLLLPCVVVFMIGRAR